MKEPRTNELLSISKRQHAVTSAVKDQANDLIKSMSIEDIVNNSMLWTVQNIDCQKDGKTFHCFVYPSSTLDKCNKMMEPCDKVRMFKIKDKQLLSEWRTLTEPIRHKWVAYESEAPVKEIDLAGDAADQIIIFGQIMDYMIKLGFKCTGSSVQLKVNQKGTDLQDGDILYFQVASIFYPNDYSGRVFVTFTEVRIDVLHKTWFTTSSRCIQFEDHQIDQTLDLDLDDQDQSWEPEIGR